MWSQRIRAACSGHVVIENKGGMLWACGYREYGRHALGMWLQRIMAACSGHVVTENKGAVLWACGFNGLGAGGNMH